MFTTTDGSGFETKRKENLRTWEYQWVGEFMSSDMCAVYCCSDFSKTPVLESCALDVMWGRIELARLLVWGYLERTVDNFSEKLFMANCSLVQKIPRKTFVGDPETSCSLKFTNIILQDNLKSLDEAFLSATTVVKTIKNVNLRKVYVQWSLHKILKAL